MELNKENMKKIMLLIVFTVLVLACAINYHTVFQYIAVFFGIIFPFVLGGIIAFIINIPMRSLEKNLFGRIPWKKKEKRKGLMRGLSMVTAMALIVAVVVLVFFVVVPQLGDTVMEVSNNIVQFWPKVQEWAMKIFSDNPEIMKWVNSIEIDWESLLKQAISFLQTGAGTILGSTFNVAKVIVNFATNFAVAFVFAIYVLLQKEKLQVQIRKVMYAFLPERVVESTLDVCRLANKTFSNFLTGQCLEAVILGCMFVIAMSIFRFPYALLIGVLIAFTALIPIFGSFIG